MVFTNYERRIFLNMDAETKTNYLHDIAVRIDSMCERLRLPKVEFRPLDIAGNGEFDGEMIWMGKRYPVLFKANCSALTRASWVLGTTIHSSDGLRRCLPRFRLPRA